MQLKWQSVAILSTIIVMVYTMVFEKNQVWRNLSLLRETSLTRNVPFRIVQIHNHDAKAFTEGFLFDGEVMVESTGRAGKSYIRRRGTDGNVTHEYQFPEKYFGEGIGICNELLYALTYKAGTGFVLNRTSLAFVDTFQYRTSTTEGWGMTSDGKSLMVSDGSDTIFYWNPKDWSQVERKLKVTLYGKSLELINELEFVDGYLWANKWFTNNIYKIDTNTGKVLLELNLSDLVHLVPNLNVIKGNDRYNAVMNGIAFNAKNQHMYVTGKLWDKVFELQINALLEH